ncbi:caspase domain-containing protein [Paenibacillus sp. 2RAB27]|uniref:caspase family protein n=1 Tax=Paenibacillus sp. 2RAB27 TaxID=3232991 RepID=UPI003F99F634
MSKTLALVVGVSNYYDSQTPNLPFCMNDVVEVRESLVNGLNIANEDIISLGESADVTTMDFIEALKKMSNLTSKEDNLIFYFSGHGGGKSGNQHCLAFTDGAISTQAIIQFLENVSAKGKAIFLDCCFSGNYSVDGASSHNINNTIDDFAGKGYAVLSSSNSIQSSYKHPDKSTSVFTSFLCDAFRDKLIVKQGTVSLNDIQKLVCLYSQVWSYRNPVKQQQPIFRANMGGTIRFKVHDYVPYQPNKIYEECDDYIIYDVKPSHSGVTKRYSVEVILKSPISLDEISKVSLEVTKKIRRAEVYNNADTQLLLSEKMANIIWIYFGRDDSDMIRKTYLCITTWVDDTQNKDWWYRVNSEDTFIIKNVHFKLLPYYESLRSLNQENMGSRERVILETREMLAILITLAERIIYQFNEYKNEILSEQELVDALESFISEVDRYYFKSTDFAIPPEDIKNWSEACSLLFGTIHDLSLYYNKKYLSQRTTANRKACMEMTISQYFSDVESVRKLEIDL